MKKATIVLMMSLVVMAVFSASVFAQEMSEMENDSQESQSGGSQGKMGGGKMNPMMMRKPTMLATSDGGVVVMEGPRLIKYDANLTLVKEVQMPKGKPPAHGKKDSAQENSEKSSSQE